MPTAPSLPTLPAGQRILLRVLVAAFVFLAAGGLFLLGSDGSSVVAAGLLLLHLGVGVAAAVLALVFVVPHALARGLSWPAAGALGVALLVATLLVAATGFLLLDGKAFAGRAAWWGHVVFGYGLFLLYVLHRALGPRPPPACRVGALAAALLAGGLLSALLGTRGAGPPARDADGGVSPFAPSRATTASGTELENAHALRDSASCGRCHRRITEDWARSAHRHASFTNPFYRGTVLAMRERYAPEDLQFCAGCHDPALLFTGKMRSPELDVDDDPDAQVGIACVVCHAMERRDLLGNGGYVLGERAVYPWEGSENASLRSLHDFLLRANPEAHRKTLRPADVGRATFCSVCHKAEIPKSLNQWRWFRAQDEYDAWDDSGVSWGSIRSFHHPSRPRACQDCHMPRVRDPQDPTADASGTVRSHLFAAANTALPHLRGDEALVEETRRFLRRACRVHIEAVELAGLEAGTPPRRFAPARRALDAVRPGQVIEVQVLVRNVGVGHGFPGGTTDSNEVWLAFEARVGDAPPFFRSGGVDEASGRVDETAEFYRSYLLDGEGRRVVSRIGPDVRTRLYVRRIPPGAADVVRYRFRVPEGAKGRLGVRAVLRYRKFMRPYVDFLFPEGHEPLPIVDLAEAEAAFAIRAGYEAGLPPDPAAVARPGDRDALNDLGIAYLLQADPLGALEIFEAVTRLDPKYADGWVNVARARIANADFDGARVALDAARRVRPGFLKARYFDGEIAMREARFAEAEAAFLDVLASWPRERMALRLLARALYEQDRCDEALGVLDRLFALDPEDARGWFEATRALRRLGRRKEAKEAEARFNAYREDDDEPVRRGRALLERPDLQRLAQPIHVHTAPSVAR